MRSDTRSGYLVDLDLSQTLVRRRGDVYGLGNSRTRWKCKRSRNNVACKSQARCSLRTQSDSVRDCPSVLTEALRGHKEEGASSLLRRKGGLRTRESGTVNRVTNILNVDGYLHRTSQSNTNSSRITNIRTVDSYRVSSGRTGVNRGNSGTVRPSSCA